MLDRDSNYMVQAVSQMNVGQMGNALRIATVDGLPFPRLRLSDDDGSDYLKCSTETPRLVFSCA